jgi:hypothetical protein
MVPGLLLLVGIVVIFAAHRAEHALAAGFWGLTTLVFFVPAGALFALVVADHERSLCGALLAIVLSGIVTGITLLWCANRLRKRSPVPRARVGRLSMLHHAAVLAVVGCAIVVGGNGELAVRLGMLGLVALPCAVGGYLGWRLLALSPAR